MSSIKDQGLQLNHQIQFANRLDNTDNNHKKLTGKTLQTNTTNINGNVKNLKTAGNTSHQLHRVNSLSVSETQSSDNSRFDNAKKEFDNKRGELREQLNTNIKKHWYGSSVKDTTDSGLTTSDLLGRMDGDNYRNNINNQQFIQTKIGTTNKESISTFSELLDSLNNLSEKDQKNAKFIYSNHKLTVTQSQGGTTDIRRACEKIAFIQIMNLTEEELRNPDSKLSQDEKLSNNLIDLFSKANRKIRVKDILSLKP